MAVPVWVKSNFSFLEGASHPKELVEQAHRLGYPAVALTDRDGLYGIVEAHVAARELGVKLLVGAEVTVGADGPGRTRRVVLLAEDRTGYGRLCRLLSKGRLRSATSAVRAREAGSSAKRSPSACGERSACSALGVRRVPASASVVPWRMHVRTSCKGRREAAW